MRTQYTKKIYTAVEWYKQVGWGIIGNGTDDTLNEVLHSWYKSNKMTNR